MSENERLQRYPLAWPMDWKRTPKSARRRAGFKSRGKDITVWDATNRVAVEVRRLGGKNLILSTNLLLRLDGLPRSDQPEPVDPGAAAYLTLKDRPIVLACDKWWRVAENIAALAAHLDALRRIERYGVGKLEQAFAGYAALPPSAEDWRIVLGVGEYATIEQVDAAFLERARSAHPDAGGTHDEMAKLTAARDLARKVLLG